MTSKDDASIQERQVTIRVLTIGTKQVTQTMYKQFPEEQVIDLETGKLLGEVWGWVNLHDKDCPSNASHLHAIWESNGQLKRAYSHKSSNHRGYRDYLMSQLCDLSTIYVHFIALADKKFTNWKREESYINLTVKGLSLRVKVPSSARTIWDTPKNIEYWQAQIESKTSSDEDGIKYYQRQIDYAIESVKEIKQSSIKQCFGTDWHKYEDLNPDQYTSYEHVYENMERRADEINKRDQIWAESYKAIEQTGQLFIAVSGVWK